MTCNMYNSNTSYVLGHVKRTFYEVSAIFVIWHFTDKKMESQKSLETLEVQNQ